MRRLACGLALAALLVGCQAPSPPPAVVARAAPKEPWRVVNHDPSAPTPALLWNGVVGVRFGRDGFGAPGDTAFHIDAYQDERIVALPNPLAARWQGLGESPSDYEQSLDLKTGLLRTSWTSANLSFEATAELVGTQLTHRLRVDGKPGQGFAWTPVPAGLGPSAGGVRSTTDTQTDGLEQQGGRLVLTRERGELRHVVAWTPSYDETPLDPGVDIEIDGPVEDQQAVRAMLHALRRAVHPRTDRATSPMHLSSSVYNGHVFWDADIWVFPALMLLEPDAAAIPRYRLKLLDGAKANFRQWVEAGRPTGTDAHTPDPGLVALADGLEPAKYPWESSVSGTERVPGPSRYQEHITGSVLWAMHQATALGLIGDAELERAGKAAAAYWLHRSSRLPSGELGVTGTMSPDEHFTGDNDLYTNLLAEWTLRTFLPDAELPRFKRPRDATSLLTYDQDPVKGYKQAAALLAVYPLQDPEAESQAGAMLRRFADKVTPNGPAMSDSVHATVEARFVDPDAAYDRWRTSWQDFTGHPLLLFSEKRRSERTYFTTGAAGCLQTVLFGFVGLRLDDQPAPGSTWSMPLRRGQVLSCAPRLPSAWKRVTVRGLQVLGRKLSVTVEQGKPPVVNEQAG